MVPVPILSSTFAQFGISMFTMHDLGIPMPVVKNVPGLVEGPAFMACPTKVTANQATKVYVDGNPALQDGHDAGYMIPHVALPANGMSLVHMALSKHKLSYPVSSVVHEGTPAGSAMMFLLSIICANPVSLPTGALILTRCTVWSRLTLKDFMKALFSIGLEVGFDALFNKITGKAKDPDARGVKRAYKLLKPSPIQEKALDGIGKIEFSKVPLDSVLSALKGNAIELTEPATAKFTHGVLLGLSLKAAVEEGGGPLMTKALGEVAVNKVTQHIVKSWAVKPAVGDLPKGKSGIGRGTLYYKWFDANP